MENNNWRSAFSVGLMFLVLAVLNSGKQIHTLFLVCSIAWVLLAIFELCRDIFEIYRDPKDS